MKFNDLVDYQVAQIMFKARNQLLPGNIQKKKLDREGGYNDFKMSMHLNWWCETVELYEHKAKAMSKHDPV